MYRTTKDFLENWDYESASTVAVFSHINNAALNKKEHENVRSIAVLCWHITTSIPEMMNRAGLAVAGVDEHSKPPSDITEIISAYKAASASLINEIGTKWTDRSLDEEVDMYGEKWTKGKILMVLTAHQTHHRGQLTVLMRQSGLKVPGVYGPSKEDWALMNMPAMD
jgi:uncharacterized damage-inducible protein DinB